MKNPSDNSEKKKCRIAGINGSIAGAPKTSESCNGPAEAAQTNCRSLIWPPESAGASRTADQVDSIY